MSQADGSVPGADELARRRATSFDQATASDPTSSQPTLAHLLAQATADRELAAADRRRAAEYLRNAHRDDLTGVLNRAPGREQLHAEIDRAHRTGARLAVMFVDVDGLKRLNDTIGHDAGDRLLAAAGQALLSSLRRYDVIVRYGGDEFVCALPGATYVIAQHSSNRGLRTLAQLVPGATFSTGHAQLRPEDTLETIVRRADTDLYRRRTDAQLGSSPPPRESAVRGADRPLALRLASDESSLACGACGARIPTSEFALLHTARMTRSADCPQCGNTTLVQLALPR